MPCAAVSRRPILGAVLAAGMVLAPAPVYAESPPLVGRIAVMAMPMSSPALGAESELGMPDLPMTLGLRCVATFPSPPMPAYYSLIARTTPVFPDEAPAFGVLGAAALLSTTSTPAGTSANTALAVGLTYQQAWGGAWWRLSPNVMFPFDLIGTLMIAPPWLEIGYDFGLVDLSLRTTATPLGLAIRF